MLQLIYNKKHLTPKLKQGGIYKLQRKNCPTTYVGQTER